MKRREFITLLGGAAAAWPLPARARPSGKTYRIGFLGPTSYAERKRDVDALRTGLRQLGYEEGRNLVIHYRWAEGRYDRLAEFAAELVKLSSKKWSQTLLALQSCGTRIIHFTEAPSKTSRQLVPGCRSS